MYAPNNRATEYVKKKTDRTKRITKQNLNYILRVQQFLTTRQQMIKDLEELAIPSVDRI